MRYLKFLKKSHSFAIGLVLVLLNVLLAIGAYCIIPDNSPAANRQQLSLALQAPGFRADFLKIPLDSVPPTSAWRTFWGGAVLQYREIPLGKYERQGDRLVVWERDKSKADTLQWQAGISTESRTFYLGTDKFGRDNLSRLVLGARVSLSVGLAAVLVSLLVGVVLGAIAGYFRGWVDMAVQWVINIFWAMPLLLWIFALLMALGRSFWQIYIAVGLAMWVEVARVVRGQLLSLREKEFAEAARALGYSHFRILFRHLLPNTFAPVAVIAAANFAAAIVLEAGLSFLGIGIEPPQPSWGSILHEYYEFIGTDKAYLALIPGVLLMLAVLGFNLLGNGIRDLLDVRL